MSVDRPHLLLRPSVIDRLLAREPNARMADYRIGLTDLKRAVRRDIEWLLNHRNVFSNSKEFKKLPHSKSSLLCYGLPDLSTYSWSSEADAQQVCTLIRDAIRMFEPRLEASTIRVDYIPTEESSIDDFHLRLRIRGDLHLDPVAEPIAFDTMIDSSTGSVLVKEST